jgi:hypothetical protein
MNGLFLFAAASFVVFLEIHQPKCIMKNIPFWNSCLCRGIVLVWMSVVAMEGVWLIGLLAFFVFFYQIFGKNSKFLLLIANLFLKLSNTWQFYQIFGVF